MTEEVTKRTRSNVFSRERGALCPPRSLGISAPFTTSESTLLPHLTSVAVSSGLPDDACRGFPATSITPLSLDLSILSELRISLCTPAHSPARSRVFTANHSPALSYSLPSSSEIEHSSPQLLAVGSAPHLFERPKCRRRKTNSRRSGTSLDTDDDFPRC